MSIVKVTCDLLDFTTAYTIHAAVTVIGMTYQVLLSRGKRNLWQIHWISESHLNQETPKRIQIPFAFYGPVSIPLQKMVFGLQITLYYFWKR